MTLEEFMAKKKVNLEVMRLARPDTVAELLRQFAALGPASFDQQYKFLFNDWRLDFPPQAPETQIPAPPQAKPA